MDAEVSPLSPLDSLKTAIEENLQAFPYLRPHQKQAIQSLQNLTQKNGSLVLATGTGKTMIQFVLANLMYNRPGNGSIIIVTPFQSLVTQTYEDMIDYCNRFGNEDHLNIPVDRIIKVSSKANNASVQKVIDSDLTNNKGIFIFCSKSFGQYITRSMSKLMNVVLTMADESHLTNKDTLKKFMEMSDCPTIGLTATPPMSDIFPQRTYCYSREEATEDKVLAPLLIERFKCSISPPQELNSFIDQMPSILRTKRHPNGQFLLDLKGIIYLPHIADTERAEKILREANIATFTINSKINSSGLEQRIKAFSAKQHHEGAVILAVGMCLVGFDDPRLNWTIIAKKCSNPDIYVQMAGRVLRKNADQADKIGYVLGFEDMDFSQFGSCRRDRKALHRAHPLFLKPFIQAKLNRNLIANMQAFMKPSIQLLYDFMLENETIYPGNKNEWGEAMRSIDEAFDVYSQYLSHSSNFQFYGSELEEYDLSLKRTKFYAQWKAIEGLLAREERAWTDYSYSNDKTKGLQQVYEIGQTLLQSFGLEVPATHQSARLRMG
ncbi:hypothetical protein TUM19329_28060 [Legionella antarctica]|uniref:Uncharacterized protein n=1 Tax=Legionella antarctica TaxID=2708020 RepID=A0A6F8T6Y7_9GAMM|nr:DEAD/DEAH box helicase family protein [Legionella antarctica]BCA96445.1 hypothetical protein TUM19329_28060 [Legionella antarctica]